MNHDNPHSSFGECENALPALRVVVPDRIGGLHELCTTFQANNLNAFCEKADAVDEFPSDFVGGTEVVPPNIERWSDFRFTFKCAAEVTAAIDLLKRSPFADAGFFALA